MAHVTQATGASMVTEASAHEQRYPSVSVTSCISNSSSKSRSSICRTVNTKHMSPPRRGSAEMHSWNHLHLCFFVTYDLPYSRHKPILPSSPRVLQLAIDSLVLSVQYAKATSVCYPSQHRDFVAHFRKCRVRSWNLFLILRSTLLVRTNNSRKIYNATFFLGL